MSSRTSLRIAKVCALLPLISGILVLALWLATKWNWLQLAGLLVLMGGGFLFLVGVIALILYEIAQPAKEWTELLSWSPTTKWALILMLNWPAAFGCIIVAETISGRFQLEVHNESAEVIDEILIFGTGSVECHETLGPISGGGMDKMSFWLNGEGSVQYRVKIGDALQEGTLIGYVSSGPGEQVSMTIRSDLTVLVKTQN